jgi:hypothetical protein
MFLCCFCFALVTGCGAPEEETGTPAANSESVPETPETPQTPPDSEEDEPPVEAEKPPSDSQQPDETTGGDADVYSVEQVLQAVRSEASDDPVVKLVEAGEEIRIRGVIAGIQPYNRHLPEGTPEPRVQLESGVPNLTRLPDTDLRVACQFSQQEELKGLKIGQTIVISGKVTLTLTAGHSRWIELEECRLRTAEPAGIASFPFYSFETSVTDYGDEGEKLEQLQTGLAAAGIDAANVSTIQNMVFDVEIENSLADDNGHLSTETIEILNEIPVISGLRLDTIDGISDEIAQDLKSLRYGQELIVGADQLTGDGLSALLEIPGIYLLQLENATELKPEDFDALQKVPYLRTLYIWNCRLEPADREAGNQALDRLQHTPRLKRLSLSGLDITDEGLRALAHLPRLRSLEVSYCDVTGKGLKHLANPEELWFLTLNGELLNDDLVESLHGMENLVSLDLTGPGVTSKIGTAFRGLKKLKRLRLSRLNVDPTFGNSIARLASLEELTLAGDAIDDGFELPLASLPELTYFSLANTQVGGNVCAALAAATSLESLNLSETPVNDDDINRLVENAANSKLREINLFDTRITQQSLISLTKLPAVKWVVISDNVELSDAARSALSEAGIKLRIQTSFGF